MDWCLFIHPLPPLIFSIGKQDFPITGNSPRQSYVELVQRVMATHRPNVPDIFTLLSALPSTEEKQQVLKATMAHYKAARQHGIQTNQDAQALWPDPLVLFNPSFEVNPNTERGAFILQRARDSILQGLKLGIPKTVNFHRIHQILQNPNESPTDFLNCLKDGFRRFTDLDPDSPANDVLLKMTFVGQSAPDTRKKLQKLETPTAKDLETLDQTAFTVYAQREEEEEKKEDKRMRKQAALLAAALNPQSKGRGLQLIPGATPSIEISVPSVINLVIGGENAPLNSNGTVEDEGNPGGEEASSQDPHKPPFPSCQLKLPSFIQKPTEGALEGHLLPQTLCLS